MWKEHMKYRVSMRGEKKRKKNKEQGRRGLTSISEAELFKFAMVEKTSTRQKKKNNGGKKVIILVTSTNFLHHRPFLSLSQARPPKGKGKG